MIEIESNIKTKMIILEIKIKTKMIIDTKIKIK